MKAITWRDSPSYPPLHWRVNSFINYEHTLKSELIQCIEERFIAVLQDGMAIDDLIYTIERMDEYMQNAVSDGVQEELDGVVNYEFTEVAEAISHLDSKEEYSEHMERLEKLAELTGQYATPALEYVAEKLSEIEQTVSVEAEMGISTRPEQDQERFDDNALHSLFSNLIDPEYEHEV